jgi:O-antigen ligase
MILYYIIVLFSALPNQPWFGTQVGGAGFTIFKYVGVLAFFYSLLYAGVKGGIPNLFQTWQIRFFVALSLLAFASYLFMGDKTNVVMSPFMIYVSFLFMCFVSLALIDTSRRLRHSLLAFMGSLALASLYVLREFQKAGFQKGYRAGYVAGDANYFAANALLALALAYYLLRTKQSRWQKAYCLGCAVLTALAFVASGSRGGFLALCVCSLFVFLRTRKKLRLVLVALLFLPVLAFSSTSPLHRILHPASGEIESSQAHEILFKGGLRVFLEHPVAGIGLGNFKSTMDSMGLFQGRSGYMAHDVYVEYAAELGIVGILLFIGILVSVYRSLERVRKLAMRYDDEFFFAVTSGMQTGLLGYCVASFFLSAEYQKTFWILIFLSASVPSLFRTRHSTADQLQAGRTEMPNDPSHLVYSDSPREIDEVDVKQT